MNGYYVTFRMCSLTRGTKDFAVRCETREKATEVLKLAGYARMSLVTLHKNFKPSGGVEVLTYDEFLDEDNIKWKIF